MKLVLTQLLSLSLLLLVAGCSSAPKTKVAPGVGTSYPKAGAGSPASGSEGRLPDGEYTVVIESHPSGATVVVNGIPVGKAPQRIVLPGTNRGFFRESVSLKVRFIAADANQSSKTVEELLTPLERIPAVMRFTVNGATRIAR